MAAQEIRIEVGAYDSDWPAAFAAEAFRLRAALGAVALRVDHHGSTSILGLGAKPIIDIQVSVAARFAASDPESREGYAREKSDFIERVVALALGSGYPRSLDDDDGSRR